MATSSNQAPESGIIRTVHDRGNQFAQINRALLQNSALSWEARGVLSYLLSKPEDWEVRFTDLVKQGPGAADRMRRILKELESAGHLLRKRLNGPDGRWHWVTLVFENPADVAFSPYADFPYMDKPYAEKPDTENRHIYKEQKRTNTESTKKEKRESAPAPVDIPTPVTAHAAPRDMQSTGQTHKPTPIRKHALPNPYPLTEEMRVWVQMEESGIGDGIDREHKKFCATYWANGETRANWRPMWELWMHRVEEFAPKQQKGSTANGRTYESPAERKEREWVAALGSIGTPSAYQNEPEPQFAALPERAADARIISLNGRRVG